MAKWAVIFDDSEGMTDRRRRFGPAHRAYMRLYDDQILAGGGLSYGPKVAPCGGLWIVEASHQDEVKDLVEHDPYYCPDHRSYRILSWEARTDRPDGLQSMPPIGHQAVL